MDIGKVSDLDTNWGKSYSVSAIKNKIKYNNSI